MPYAARAQYFKLLKHYYKVVNFLPAVYFVIFGGREVLFHLFAAGGTLFFAYVGAAEYDYKVAAVGAEGCRKPCRRGCSVFCGEQNFLPDMPM